MLPFAFWWYVSVERFDLFGNLRVIPIVRPGNLEVGGEVIGFNFPAHVQARVRSGLKMIISATANTGALSSDPPSEDEGRTAYSGVQVL